ncbi:hypothetical protein A1Q1_02901 [Trichosporon asahii var. asahii CBS 2479]|uniref:Uncharacterized protein n=1 Tax=Trichosporon asahii var. asahii (strain ATCC 90039 / CBS 2479 / JCM 2466 / KCTC 7840 / NBRC 103889/ NCYC 2677 / UAMH 7654) TaxID=1186058 RepID=J5SXS3_TRIAS|nr:hypothetical protein A1Q1_02901 [Trichosporon asahii var. asahii CBS 2479]EJT48091.1 hypothetical protein A1Q1_02901 [Trichosporon asahii var. asahii CBS 2479]
MADNDKGWSARGCNDTVILLAHASLVRQRALRVGLAKLDGPDIDEEGEENDWPVTGTALSSDDEAFIARLVQSGAIACGRASARSAAQGMQREQMRHPVLLLHRLCHMTKVCRGGSTAPVAYQQGQGNRSVAGRKEGRTPTGLSGTGSVLVLLSAKELRRAASQRTEGRRSETQVPMGRLTG